MGSGGKEEGVGGMAVRENEQCLPCVIRAKFRPRKQRETRGAELALPGEGKVREDSLEKVAPERGLEYPYQEQLEGHPLLKEQQEEKRKDVK